jgi:hypothetical protein
MSFLLGIEKGNKPPPTCTGKTNLSIVDKYFQMPLKSQKITSKWAFT